MNFTILVIKLAILTRLIKCQIDTYASSFDSINFAHQIEFQNSDCTYYQNQYSVYFWHRFSFTSPKYTNEIQSFDLVRVVFNQNFSNMSKYEDRVIYVESDGISFNICSHDTVTSSYNVCKTIDVSSYRYDSQWIFMYLQYKDIGEISIYINYQTQKSEIFEKLSNVNNVNPSNYIGAFFGGAKFKTYSLNGQIFNPQLVLGHQSQIKNYNDIVAIMNEKPANDYIKNQFIYIQQNDKTIEGIYTKFAVYGTIYSSSNSANNNKIILTMDGSNKNTGKVSSSLMEITLKDNKLNFYSDNYATLKTKSDDEIKKWLFSCSILEQYELFFYFAVNMEQNTVNIYCNQTNTAQISSTIINKLYIPQKIIFSFSSNFNGKYLERNFLGGEYSTSPYDYMKTKTISDTLSYTTYVQKPPYFKSFSICFWFRLFTSFPEEKSNGSQIFSDPTKIQPLIALNLQQTPIIDFTGQQDNYLAYGYLENKYIKYYSYKLQQTIPNQIYSNIAKQVVNEWEWMATCITYKEAVNTADSYIKSYQYVSQSYQEVYFTTNIDQTGMTNFYLQLTFQNSLTNVQYYNIQINLSSDYSSFIEEQVGFQYYINDFPLIQLIDKMVVNFLIKDQQSITSTLDYYGEGFNFSLEYSLSLWCKFTALTPQDIIRMELSSTFQVLGTFFYISFDGVNISLYTSNQSITLVTDSTIPASSFTQYFFIYAGQSKQVNKVTLGILYNDGTQMVRKNFATACTSYIPLSKYHVQIKNTFNGYIADLRLNIGQYSYELIAFDEKSLQGKWECGYKSKICTQPQVQNTKYSLMCSNQFALDNNQCVVQCPCSQFNTGNICTSCSIPQCGYCMSNAAQDQCSFCKEGYQLNYNTPITETPLGSCECKRPGYILYNGVCQKCSKRCAECSLTLSACTKCVSEAYLSNNQCYPIDGYYYDSNDDILLCDKSCRTCLNIATYCTDCHRDKLRVLNASTHTCECGSKYVEVYNQTTNIPECVLCDSNSGSIKVSNNQCVKCDDNCQLCIDSTTKCTQCNSSTQKRVLNTLTNTCDCLPGYYGQNGKYGNCFQCSSTCKQCSSSTFCTMCSNDRILQKVSNTVQKCICDKSQNLFENSQGFCESSYLQASLSDYYSTTRTDTIYFSILFNKDTQNYLIQPNTFIKSIKLDYIQNPSDVQINYENDSQSSQTLTSDEDSKVKYQISMSWQSSSEIQVMIKFNVSFMKKNLTIEFTNPNEFYVKNSNEFLITKQLTFRINFILSPTEAYDSQLQNLIKASNKITQTENSFVKFLQGIFKGFYVLLFLLPFLQVCLLLFVLDTILPTNFYHFLRIFIHLTVTKNVSMQEENSQKTSIDYFFVSGEVNLKEYQSYVDIKFCRLNFVNSSVVMIGAPILFLSIIQIIYIIIDKIYYLESTSLTRAIQNIQGLQTNRVFKIIQIIYKLINNISSMLFEALFFIISCSIIINIKSQYLLYTQQILGYILSILIMWMFSLYVSNLYSIFTNHLHYKQVFHDRLYLNYLPSQRIYDIIQRELYNDYMISSSPQICFQVEDNKLIIKENASHSITFMQKLKSMRIYYHLINLIRKTIISIFILVFSDTFLAQIIPYFIIQIFLIAYTILFIPYQNIQINSIKIAAEINLLIVIILIMASREYEQYLQSEFLKDEIPDSKIENFLRVGEAIMIFFSFYMVLHFIVTANKMIHHFITPNKQNNSSFSKNETFDINDEDKMSNQMELVMINSSKKVSLTTNRATIERSKDSLEYIDVKLPQFINQQSFRKRKELTKNE